MASSNANSSSVDVEGGTSLSFQSTAPIGDRGGPLNTEVSIPSTAGNSNADITAATSQELSSVASHNDGVSDRVKDNEQVYSKHEHSPQPTLTAHGNADSSAVSNAYTLEHGTSTLRGSTNLAESPAAQVPLWQTSLPARKSMNKR